MKRTMLRLSIVAVLLPIFGDIAFGEAVGTAFTYQGQLKDDGVPVNGNYDMRFELYDQPAEGTLIGTLVFDGDFISQNPPPVPIANGLFTVELDFGAGVFTGEGRWLQISVHRHMTPGSYERLSPPQPITSTPYALYALSAPGGSGYWTLNGGAIYNNNRPGYVGVGTSSPQYNLHVRRDGTVGGFIHPARLGVQRFLGVMPPGTSLNDWFAIEVGGEVMGPAPGTRLVREAGTNLFFQTEETMNAAIRSTQMTLAADGNVGIGTTTPDALLEVESASGVHGIRSTTSAIPIAAYRTSTSGTWPAIHAECASLAGGATAIRGYITSTSPGSGSAAVSGHNYGASMNGYGVKGSHAGSGTGVYGVSANYGTGVYGESTNGFGLYGKSTNGYAGYFDGTVSVKVLEITGADLAERFPVSDRVEPGMVVAIDPKHPGQLCLARGAYNRCVAGVVSGANDLPAGAVLGHLPGREDDPPVALSGRVWVRCDASTHSINPGDLLTTAATPGHAMAVTDYPRAQGAIIGKAMTSLESGRGMVLVLVSLQ